MTAPAERGPLALGYIRRHPLMTDAEQEGLRAAMSSFATASGLRLGEVYIDTPGSTPRQFGALVTAAQQQRATAVLVADVSHLAVLGGERGVRAHLETYTNARLMVVPDTRPQAGEVGARGPSSTPHG